MLKEENLIRESIKVLECFEKFKAQLTADPAISYKEKRKLANKFMIDLSGQIENVKSADNYTKNMYDEYEIPIRLYQVQKTSKVVLFAHGGGNIQGNFDTHDYLCRKMARTLSVDVVAVEYRLSP